MTSDNADGFAVPVETETEGAKASSPSEDQNDDRKKGSAQQAEATTIARVNVSGEGATEEEDAGGAGDGTAREKDKDEDDAVGAAAALSDATTTTRTTGEGFSMRNFVIGPQKEAQGGPSSSAGPSNDGDGDDDDNDGFDNDEEGADRDGGGGDDGGGKAPITGSDFLSLLPPPIIKPPDINNTELTTEQHNEQMIAAATAANAAAQANLTNIGNMLIAAGALPGPLPGALPGKVGVGKSGARGRADKGNGAEAVQRVAKRRPLRSAADITQEELSSCFHLPSEVACKKLGIGLTVLKRQCRKFGIKRWPFRKMKSLDRLITNVQAGISPGDQNRVLVKSVEELEEQKRRMEECQVLDLDDNTKRLQQAYSKANHKARRMAQGPEMSGMGGLLALGSDSRGVGSAVEGATTPGVHVGNGSNTKAAAAAMKGRNTEENDVLEATTKAVQEQLLQGVAATIPGIIPGGLDVNQVNMAAAVAATAAAMSGQGDDVKLTNINAAQQTATAHLLAAINATNQQAQGNAPALATILARSGLGGGGIATAAQAGNNALLTALESLGKAVGGGGAQDESGLLGGGDAGTNLRRGSMATAATVKGRAAVTARKRTIDGAGGGALRRILSHRSTAATGSGWKTTG